MASEFPQKFEHLKILVKACNKQAVRLVFLVLLTYKHGLIVFVSIKLEADLVPNFYLLAVEDKLDDCYLLVYYCYMKRVNLCHLLDDLKVILKIGDFDKAASEKCDWVLIEECGEILNQTLRCKLAK